MNAIHASDQPNNDEQKFPSVFAVLQQQGPTCPQIPWINLKTVKNMRERGHGTIQLQNSDYVTKTYSYATFLPCIRAYDIVLDELRNGSDHYAQYENQLRTKGIKSTERFGKNGTPINEIDFWPTDKARRESYTPYNIKVEHYNLYNRWLPVFHNPKNDNFYFYNYESKKLEQLQSVGKQALNYDTDSPMYILEQKKDGSIFDIFSEDTTKVQIKNSNSPEYYRFTTNQMNFMNINSVNYKVIDKHFYFPIITGEQIIGSGTGYYTPCSKHDIYEKEAFYEVGTFQHILFALGLDKANQPFTNNSKEWNAYQEFKLAMDKDQRNPFCQIKKEDLFEYQLACIFQSDQNLKNKAKAVVEFYNEPWKFYQESFNLFGSNGVSLKDKMDYMPGEDQMLAYYFAAQLRFCWAATISISAVTDIMELNNDLGEFMTKIISCLKSTNEIMDAARKPMNQNKDSFISVWNEIKDKLTKEVKQKDFVSFSGHGVVISLDESLVSQQQHEHEQVAKELGIELWDSLYEKGLKPFYQKKGKKEDLVTFPQDKNI